MSLRLHTSWGDLIATIDCGKVRTLRLAPLRGRPRKAFAFWGVTKDDQTDERVAHEVERFVKACLTGRTAPRPPFDLPAGPSFHQKVWRAMLRIPMGRTLAYGELARRIGHPRAARAVGQACRANPLPLIIPCHRVTAADGGLGGFSCGLAWKEWLLARERNGVAPFELTRRG